MLDTKDLNQKYFTSRVFAEILIRGSQTTFSCNLILRFNSDMIYFSIQIKVKPLNNGHLPVWALCANKEA